MLSQQKTKTHLIILWIFFAAISRLIPHPPNVTPLTNLCLFAGSQLSRLWSFIILLSSLLLSDLALHYLQGYPLFGSWMIFTYSGFLFITLIATQLSTTPSWKRLFYYVLICSFGYWLWTNFGTWLLSGLYAKSFPGLLTCYIVAIPFLRNQILGDLLWMAVIFGSYRVFLKYRGGKYARGKYKKRIVFFQTRN